MSYFSKEIPTGAVDGSNKTFTLSHTIYQIDDCFLDGAIYLGTISVSGSTIVFGDAPTTSIFIDYYDAAPPSPGFTPGVINVYQARQSLQNRLQDIADVPLATFIEWCDWLNKFVYRQVLASDPGRYTKSFGLTTINGQSQYPMNIVAPDFRDFSIWETGIYGLASDGTPFNLPMARTCYGSLQYGYWLDWDTTNHCTRINITPTPQQPQSYTVRYTPVPPDLGALGDYFTFDKTATGSAIISGEWMRLVVEGLSALYMAWDEDAGNEAYSDARFVRVLEEFMRNIKKEPTVYGMEDWANTF